MRKIIRLLAALVLAGALRAEAYLADANTGPDSSTIGTRLFADAAATVPSPVSNLVWFVADLSLNGVPAAPTAGHILGADDVLIFQDMVDGTLLGDQAGRYARNGIVVPDAFSNANIYVYSWNVLSNATVGQAGQTFGLTNLGAVTVPLFGNAKWVVSAPIHGDEFVVSSSAMVPEPSTVLLLLLGAGLLQRARYRACRPAHWTRQHHANQATDSRTPPHPSP